MQSAITTTGPDPVRTGRIRARYQRIAPLYDLMDGLAEIRHIPWRRRLWDDLRQMTNPGERVLELGVGTGKSMPFWPQDMEVTAVDLTPGMLRRARARMRALGLAGVLELGDVQRLRYPDRSFDAAVATFVFCSVTDPILGLREVRRVVRPGGPVMLLEHMRSPIPWLGGLMDLINPLIVRAVGANINRDTVGNVVQAGLVVNRVKELGSAGIFKLIEAHVPEAEHVA